jgi:hypothetical protein
MANGPPVELEMRRTGTGTDEPFFEGESRRRADFFVRATVGLKNRAVRRVPCKIYLPRGTTEQPVVVLQPNGRAWEAIGNAFECSLNAVGRRLDGRQNSTIVASRMYVVRPTRTSWGKTLTEFEVVCRPVDLMVRRRIGDRKSSFRRRSLQYWISPNTALEPLLSRCVSFDGSTTARRTHAFRQTLSCGLSLVLDVHFRQEQRQDGSFVEHSFLVAKGEIPEKEHNSVEAAAGRVADLDDYLLIASFGSRVRTMCVGWQVSAGGQVIEFYRRDIRVPDGRQEASLDSGLIPREHFRPFVRVAYRRFLNISEKKSLRRAIHVLVPASDDTLEKRYVSLFAGLEDLVLAHRRSRNIEFVLTHPNFARLERHLRHSIRSFEEFSLSPKQRGRIYGNLKALNRVALRDALDDYCERYSAKIDDLWPVFDQGKGVGLATIRNRIVHGDFRTQGVQEALLVAMEHLAWTLERLLLARLKWPVEKSEVSPEFLRRNATGIVLLGEARSQLRTVWQAAQEGR